MGEHIEVDRMLFLAEVIDQQIEVIDAGPVVNAALGMPYLWDGVADIAREQIEKAQTQLDALIEEDTSWRPL